MAARESGWPSLAPAVTDRDDPPFGDIDFFTVTHSEHDGLEGKHEVLLDGRVESNRLFGFGVRIDDGLLDQCLETCRRDPGGGTPVVPCGSGCRSSPRLLPPALPSVAEL